MPSTPPSIRGAIAAFALVASALASPPLAAQEDQEEAVRLAGEAGAAFQNGEFEIAAEKYAAAYENYPDVSLKLNEMAAWYKAQRCVPALDAAAQAAESTELGERDEADLHRVNSECGYAAAEKMFDDGDLDSAEERLALIQTGDVDLAQKIGILRGKIEERRRLLAEQETTVPAPPPPEAPARPLMPGVAIAGAGAGVAVLLLGKGVLYDAGKVRRYSEAFEEGVHGCSLTPKRAEDQNRPRCGTIPAARAEPDFEAYERFRKGVNVSRVVGYSAAVGLMAAGAVLYFMGSSETAGTVSVVPALGPDGVGGHFVVRF